MIDGLRPVDDDDRDGLIHLIGSVFAEYPGCVLDLDGLDHDLLAPGTDARERGSPWWVVEREGRIVATVGAGALRDGGCVELKRLYVDADHRRQGLAAALVSLVEDHARQLGGRAVDLWSDTRFADAHRLYTRLGYRDTGERRRLNDPSDTTERHFERRL